MKILYLQNLDDDIVTGIGDTLSVLSSMSSVSLIKYDHNKPLYDLIDENKPDLCIGGILDVITVDDILEECGISTIIIGEFETNKPHHILVTDIPRAANTVRYKSTATSSNLKYQSDILYLSHYPLNKTQRELLTQILGLNYKVKICGNIKLPIPEYLGKTTPEVERELISATKLGIDFHGHMWRNYLINDKVCLMSPSIDDEDDISQLHLNIDNIKKYLDSSPAKLWLGIHTYFHRSADIFTKLDCQKIVDFLMEQIPK